MGSKKFCVVSPGRCGSSAFMRALNAFDDIASPCKNSQLLFSELLHPDFIEEAYSIYSALGDLNDRTPSKLIDCFYDVNSNFPFAGFKLLFCQSSGVSQLWFSRDIQFITLVRRDIASAMASCMMASDTGDWNRQGGGHKRGWSYSSAREEELKGRVEAHFKAVITLKSIPNTIVIYYEDIARGGFVDASLREFFGRDVRLAEPKEPTSGESYVRNWGEFRGLVDVFWRECFHAG